MGFVAGILGASLVVVAVRRAHRRAEAPDVLAVMLLGGLALMFAGAVVIGGGA